MVFKANEAQSESEHLALLHKALEINPGCVDAEILLSGYECGFLGDRVQRVERATEHAKRLLGQEFYEWAGHFWGFVETRPYIRGLSYIATEYLEFDRYEKAIPYLELALAYNPNDNTGARYMLVPAYLCKQQFFSAIALIDAYKDDGSAWWLWSAAFAAFLHPLPKDAADRPDKALREAHAANPHVYSYLIGENALKRKKPPYYSPGGESEAACAAKALRQIMKANKSLKKWLLHVTMTDT